MKKRNILLCLLGITLILLIIFSCTEPVDTTENSNNKKDPESEKDFFSYSNKVLIDEDVTEFSAVEKNDKIFIGYFTDDGNSWTGNDPESVMYAVYDNDEWNTYFTDLTDDYLKCPSISVDNTENIYITFSKFPSTYGNYIYYLTNETGVWEKNEIFDVSEKDAIFDISTEMDSNNNLHLIYNENYTDFSHSYYNTSTSSWDTNNIYDEVSNGSMNPVSAIYNDVLYAAYYDSLNDDLRIAAYQTGTWSSETLDSTDDVGKYPDIAIDSNGNIHIAYYSVSADSLKYITNKSGDWEIDTIYTYTAGNTYSINYISIDTDSENNAHICFSATEWQIGKSSGYKNYATNKSGIWEYTTLETSSSLSVDKNIIIIDENDNINIIYKYGGDLYHLYLELKDN